jgi:hypothetical protein
MMGFEVASEGNFWQKDLGPVAVGGATSGNQLA